MEDRKAAPCPFLSGIKLEEGGVDAWKFAGGNSKGFSPINVPN